MNPISALNQIQSTENSGPLFTPKLVAITADTERPNERNEQNKKI
jgi:hypothetical protein